MTMLAVAGSENATGVQPGATPTGEGTGAPPPSQAGGNGDGQNSAPDPVEQLVATRLEQEREKLTAEAEERAAANLRESQRVERRQQAVADSGKEFTTTLKDITGALGKPITVEIPDGMGGTKPVTFNLGADQIQKMVADPLNGFNTKAKEVFETAIFGELADIADEALPNDAARDAFVEVADGKSPKEWLEGLINVGLRHAGLVEEVLEGKTLGDYQKDAAGKPLKAQVKLLGDAIKASIALAKAQGFAEGQGNPPAEPKGSGGRATVSIEGKTAREIAEMHLTAEQLDAEIKRLKNK